MGAGTIAQEAYALAGRQNWLLRRDQLLEMGFTEYDARKWRESGALVQLMPSIYRLSLYPESWAQQVQSAVWWGGAGAAACGPSAAALYALGRYPRTGPVHLSIPGSRHLSTDLPFGVVLHPERTLAHWDVALRSGISVIRIERILVDLAATLEISELEALVDEAIDRELTHVRRLRACLERVRTKGRAGVSTFAKLLEVRGNTLLRVDSPLEKKFQILFPELGLESPEPRFWVCRGMVRYRLDFAYVELKLGIEIDSREFHEPWEARLADMARQNNLVSWGWTILRFTSEDLAFPDRVAGVIRQTLALLRNRSSAAA